MSTCLVHRIPDCELCLLVLEEQGIWSEPPETPHLCPDCGFEYTDDCVACNPKPRVEFKMKIGLGIFGWDRNERVTNRYGAINLADATFDSEHKCAGSFLDTHSALGKRVRLTARVLEARKSAHLGDKALGIVPTTPEVGETIDLGVGVLMQATNAVGEPMALLMPGILRDELWMDPRLLYRLHDQTVELFAEPTDEPFSPMPDLPPVSESIISNGDGSFQTKKTKLTDGDQLQGATTVEKLGDGLLKVSYSTPEAGTHMKRAPQ